MPDTIFTNADLDAFIAPINTSVCTWKVRGLGLLIPRCPSADVRPARAGKPRGVRVGKLLLVGAIEASY